MTWLKFTRGLRRAFWMTAAVLAGYEVWYLQHRIERLEMSAPQAAAFAGVILAELMALYITVRALDCACELSERGLLERSRNDANAINEQKTTS